MVLLRVLLVWGSMTHLVFGAGRFAFPYPEKPDKPVPPNVIWIIANDLGPGDLGCYGQTNIHTPNIDRLAREGTLFTRCHVPSPDDLVSRAGLLTGRDFRHLDLLTNAPVGIEPGITTIGHLSRARGHTNGYFGKWLLGGAGRYSQPQRKGFDEWLGELLPQTVTDFYPDSMSRRDPQRGFDGEMQFSFNHGDRSGIYLNDFFIRATTNLVRINHPHRFNRFVPFFIVTAFALPNPLDDWTGNTNRFVAVPELGRYAVRDWPPAERQRAAAVSRLDFSVGELFKVLERYQQIDKTAIFLTSDAGPFRRGGSDPDFFNSTEGRRGGRGDLTEGGLRVPLIVSWPGHAPRRATNDLLCSLLDLMPTSAEIIGAPVPDDIDGISFLPSLLRREQTNRHDLLVWRKEGRHAIRFGDWKAMQSTNATWELYLPGEDPAETNNLAGRRPMVLQSITNRLAEWLQPPPTARK